MSPVSAETLLPPGMQVVVDGHGLPDDSYSFMVQEVDSQTPIMAVNQDTSINPASTAKLVTTLAALELLGPAYTWKTELYTLGPVNNGVLAGDLLIKGGGDPFLVEEQLRAMLKALQREGIHHIQGNLVLDDSYFDQSVNGSGQIDQQVGRAYNTEPSAVIANFQTVNFYFTPHPNGRNVMVMTDPDLPNLKIDNRLRLVNRSCGGYQRGISFNLNQGDPSQVILEGSFPSSCQNYRMVREVLDAPGYTFGLFKELWEELGGKLDGEFRLGIAPLEAEPVLTWNSPPMSDIVKSINKFSNNLMTRHLLLTLGAEALGPPATIEKGVASLDKYLLRIGLDPVTLNMVNGSGLSRDTRVTTFFMNRLLQEAWRSPYMPEFISSLPLNGIDGTMQLRLRGRELNGRMHIKTGSLDEVAAVGGYVYSKSGRFFTVSGIVNHELADRGPGIELLDALLMWVYEQ